MKGLWARFTGRVRAEQADQADVLSHMTPAERETAEEPPIERAEDERIERAVSRDPDPDDPDGPDRLLTGLGS
jgi:hypothetical protein